METFRLTLGGTSVTIGGQAAYLSFVSPEQINLQVPNDAATGAVPVVVTTGTGRATSTVNLAQFGPSFFLLDASHVAGIILRADGSGAYGGGAYDIVGPTGTSLGYQTVAAKAGDIVELFGTGFGPTNPTVPGRPSFFRRSAHHKSGDAPDQQPERDTGVCRLIRRRCLPAQPHIPSGLGTGDVSLQATVGGVQTLSGVVISLQ